MSHPEKSNDYEELVNDRADCRDCKTLGLTNARTWKQGKFDERDPQVGPWTQWYGDLNADLMIVGQDWGGIKYYDSHEGREQDDNPTNIRLRKLLATIGYSINLPTGEKLAQSLYFTNAILCHKPGALTGRVPPAAFQKCSRFLRRQIEIVGPKVIVPLGYAAYRAFLMTYCRWPEETMTAAVERKEFEAVGEGGSLVMPVFHPGFYGTKARPADAQIHDWERVRSALELKGVVTPSTAS